jgi:hypothetical protein
MAKIFGGFVIGYLLFMIAMWGYSAQQIKKVCGQVSVGMSVTELRQRVANAYVIQGRERKDGQKTALLLHSSYSFGRYTCDIRHSGQRVTQVRYSFLD